MKAYFDLIEVDMNDFFTICTDFCNLSIEIDRVTATRTTRNDNPDDFCFLLHVA